MQQSGVGADSGGAGGIKRLCQAYTAISKTNVVSMRSLPPARPSSQHIVLVVYDDSEVDHISASDANSLCGINTNTCLWKLSKEELGRKEGQVHQDLLLKIGGRVQQIARASHSYLLGIALAWLYADVYALFSVHESMLEAGAEMFGALGVDMVMEFKRNFLTERSENYKVDAIHHVDVKNRAVVADFECLIPEKEGRGTDVVVFSQAWKVAKVQAIRHSL